LVVAVASITQTEGLTVLTPSFLLSLLLAVVVAALTQLLLVSVAVLAAVALGRAALAARALRAKVITAVQVNPAPILMMEVAAVAAVLVP
jgi:hypothetical protein